jgi:hypothetical protein
MAVVVGENRDDGWALRFDCVLVGVAGTWRFVT